MNKGNATILSVIALALVVALGVVYFSATPKGEKGDRGEPGSPGLTITGPAGENGINGENGEVDSALLRNLQNVLRSLSDTITALPKTNLGAVVSPNFQGPCVYYNGVKECSYELNIASSWSGKEGTTTFASFDPTRDIATSTLISDRFGCNIRPIATTTYIEFGGGATPNATTSRVGAEGNIDAGTGQAIVGSSTSITAGVGTQNLVFSRQGAGYRYFNLKAAGGTNGTLRPTGACNATFRELVPNVGVN